MILNHKIHSFMSGKNSVITMIKLKLAKMNCYRKKCFLGSWKYVWNIYLWIYTTQTKIKYIFFEDEYFKSEVFYFLWSNFVIDYILFKIKLVFQWIGVEKT